MAELLLSHDRRKGPFVRAERIQRTTTNVRQLLRTTRNIALATVTPNGRPHNTVLSSGFGIPDHEGAFAVDMRCRWWSYANSRHSRNLQHNPLGSIAVFNSEADKSALTVNVHVAAVPASQLPAELITYNAVRRARGLPAMPDHVFDPAKAERPMTLYVATPEHIEVGAAVVTPSQMYPRGLQQVDIAPYSLTEAHILRPPVADRPRAGLTLGQIAAR